MDFLQSDFDAELVPQIDADQTKIRIGTRSFSPSDVLKSMPDAYKQDFRSWIWETWLPERSRILGDIKRFENNNARFSELCIAVANVVPFVGSGMSVPSGVPTWSDFLRRLRRASTLGATALERYVSEAQFEAAATALQTAMTKKLFNECFEQTFRVKTGFEVAGPIRLLPKAFDSSVITTNFDNVLEALYELRAQAFQQTLYGIGIKDYRRFKASGDRCLLKLHGNYRHPASRVLTRGEYSKFYGPRSPAAKEFALIFRTHSLLFLGCSLSNDRTMQLLRAVAVKDHAMPKHFAFLKKPADEQVRIEREQFLTERGIFTVWYENDHDEALEALLAGILQARNRI